MLPGGSILAEVTWNTAWFGFLDHFTAFSGVVAALFIGWRYYNDRRDAKDRAADDRFMAAAASLSSENARERLAGSVMLRTFLTPSLKRFYPIIFDYSVGLLRSRPESVPVDDTKTGMQRKYQSPNEEERMVYQSIVPSLAGASRGMQMPEVDNPEYGLDARYMSLDWLLVDNAQLNSVNFEGSSLIGTSIRRSSARATDWSGIHGHLAYFEKADLTRARIYRANFVQGGFSDCIANRLNLLGTKMIHTTVARCEMQNCNFEQLHVEGGVFDKCDFQRTSFYLARFTEAAIYRSDLRHVDMDGAKFYSGCSIEDCDLTGADLGAVVLDRVLLNRSDFTGVNFMAVGSMNHAQMYDVKGIAPETMRYLVEKWNVSTNMDFLPQPLQTPLESSPSLEDLGK
jgi:uncharacterized protein YjbI with pentapeptide repeats